MTASTLEPVRATFRAVATTVVPETVALDPAGWSVLEHTVEHALAARSEGMRGQLLTFLRVIEFLPIVWFGRRFSRLGPGERNAVLKRLEASRFPLIRRGFWGLRTLVLMGYYTQPEIQVRIGYRAHANGWALRRRSGEQPATSQAPITLEVPALPDEPPATGRA